MHCDDYRRELDKNLGSIEFANPLVLTYDGVQLEGFARRLEYYLQHPTERNRLGSRRGSHAG